MKVKRCPKGCEFDWVKFLGDLDDAVAHLIVEEDLQPSATTLMTFMEYSHQKQLLQEAKE